MPLISVLLLLLWGCSKVSSPGHVIKEVPIEGQILPNVQLQTPKGNEDTRYLGVKDNDVFRISQIDSPVIIIEIFSMYCPYCQKAAPIVNELYQHIQNDMNLKQKVKLIGIGVTNTPYETETFRKNYDIQFPLFPDADGSITRNFGILRTPYFIGVVNRNGKELQIVESKAGAFSDPKDFLDILMKKAELYHP